MAEKIAYALTRPLPQSPPADASDSDQSAYQKHVVNSEITSCIMLASMTTEFQIHHEYMEEYTIVDHLREIFDKHAKSERFKVSKLLFSTKMKVGTSPMQHELKMNTYIERLGKLGFVIDHELSIDLITFSLTGNFAQFVLNYHMNNKETSIRELINLLKIVEHTLPTLNKKAKTMMLVGCSDSKKSSTNKKKETPLKAKGGVTKKKAKEAPTKGTCFHCGQDGH